MAQTAPALEWIDLAHVRKLYYNMTITAISAFIAVGVGGLEVLNIVGDQMNLHGWFWSQVNKLGDHFGAIGIAIIGIFIVAWVMSALCYRAFGYHRLELIPQTVEAEVMV